MFRSLRLPLAAFALGSVGGACALTFPCSSDQECTRGGAAGTCQASGYCSFPDASCESEQRYGELAPANLAGTCVPGGDGSGTDTNTSMGTATSGSSGGMTSSTAPDGTSTSGSSDGPTTLDGTEESSGDTGEPACCNAGCDGTCEASCDEVEIGGPATDQEAIGVAVVGDWVVWSTGYGRTLRLASVDTGSDQVLATIGDNSFVTKIAGDDTHVYFVDWGGPIVRRISVPEGTVDLVTQVDEATANFGGIAVGAEHVYFAMRGSGGIWRAAKDLSDQDEAEPVADATQPFDVALDDTHVYWIDNEMDRIERLALADIGGGVLPSTIYDGSDLTTLAVDDTHVYFGDGNTIARALKDVPNQGIEMLASGQGNVWDIAVDPTHVYWTSSSNNEVGRVPIGGGEHEVLADTPSPWGLDLSCTGVFWAENGTQTLHTILK